MYLIVVTFPVKPEHAEQWPEIVREDTGATRAEPGTMWFRWSRSRDDPNEFVLLAAFEDDGAAPHVQSEHFAKVARAWSHYLTTTPKIVSRQGEGDGWEEMGEIRVECSQRRLNGASAREGALMWLTSWSDLYAILVVGLACYLTVVVLLRATGKRTLTKLNAFDFVVTVSIGSLLATGVVDPGTSWAAVACGILLLVVAQWVMAQVTARWPRSRWLVTAEPTLVLRDGSLLQDGLRRTRVAPSEVLQAVRTSGSGSLASVAAVTLEPDGSLSVISKESLGDGSALADVPGMAGEAGSVPGLPQPEEGRS